MVLCSVFSVLDITLEPIFLFLHGDADFSPNPFR